MAVAARRDASAPVCAARWDFGEGSMNFGHVIAKRPGVGWRGARAAALLSLVLALLAAGSPVRAEDPPGLDVGARGGIVDVLAQHGLGNIP